MIQSHTAPSCFNVSSYRATWTHFSSNSTILIKKYAVLGLGLGPTTGAGLGRKAATLVCEFEKLAFAYFALVSLTSVHKTQKIVSTWPLEFLEAPNG